MKSVPPHKCVVDISSVVVKENTSIPRLEGFSWFSSDDLDIHKAW
jgi:hypothetical protein